MNFNNVNVIIFSLRTLHVESHKDFTSEAIGDKLLPPNFEIQRSCTKGVGGIKYYSGGPPHVPNEKVFCVDSSLPSPG